MSRQDRVALVTANPILGRGQGSNFEDLAIEPQVMSKAVSTAVLAGLGAGARGED